MTRCEEYLELISAYVDGELSESEKLDVEEHVGGCGECSAILEMYREMSLAAKETVVPAPAELLEGVMSEIGGTKQRHRASALKISKRLHLIQSRIIPLAACLIFAILLIPIIRNLNRGISSRDTGAGNSMSQNDARQSSETSEANSGGGSGAADQSAGDGNAVSPGAGGGGMTGNATAPSDDGAGGMDAGSVDMQFSVADEAAPENMWNLDDLPGESDFEDPQNQYGAEKGADILLGTENQTEGQPADQPEQIPEPSHDYDVSDKPAMAGGMADESSMDDGAVLEEEITSDFDSNARIQYHVVIYVRGEVPDVLSGFEQVRVGDSAWHVFIPRDLALELIASNMPGITEIQYGDPQSRDAIVICIGENYW